VPDNGSHFCWKATGIGSVPFLDILGTCQSIFQLLPDIPFWPQFVQISYREGMNIQFSEGLPLLEIHHEKRSLLLNPTPDKETQLVEFYDHFLAHDVDYFAVSREFAPGLYTLLEILSGTSRGDSGFIKGQSVGPITFAAGIPDLEGKPVLHSPELLEAFTQGLAIKALWQVRRLAESGRKPILFLDEPYLSGFGSAFSPIAREEVVHILRTVIDYLKQHADLLIGIHCCGNTDWGMLMEAEPDIINFDAFSCLDYFLLYPKEITAFISRGGCIAWGVVPTSEFTGKETVASLLSIIKKGFNTLESWGLSAKTVANSSILTPSCGMGTMPSESADSALTLLSELSSSCEETDVLMPFPA